jgi:LPS sulfotransferase NodH
MFERSVVDGAMDSPSLRLPSFIHVGPPRTGTTWLYEVLKGHAMLSDPKETRFFDDRYNLGIDWYAERFGAGPQTGIVGECYPGYFANPLARRRIKKHIPDCRIICTFREPAARLYSTWRIIRARRLPVDPSFDRYWRLLVARGSELCRYAAQLCEWQREFGEARVLATFYEDLNSDPQKYLDTICEFVGIPQILVDQSPVGRTKVHEAWHAARANSISQLVGKGYWWLVSHGMKSAMTAGVARRAKSRMQTMFIEQFEPLSEAAAEEIRWIALSDTEILERITGRDLTGWKPRSRHVS